MAAWRRAEPVMEIRRQRGSARGAQSHNDVPFTQATGVALAEAADLIAPPPQDRAFFRLWHLLFRLEDAALDLPWRGQPGLLFKSSPRLPQVAAVKSSTHPTAAIRQIVRPLHHAFCERFH